MPRITFSSYASVIKEPYDEPWYGPLLPSLVRARRPTRQRDVMEAKRHYGKRSSERASGASDGGNNFLPACEPHAMEERRGEVFGLVTKEAGKAI